MHIIAAFFIASCVHDRFRLIAVTFDLTCVVSVLRLRFVLLERNESSDVTSNTSGDSVETKIFAHVGASHGGTKFMWRKFMSARMRDVNFEMDLHCSGVSNR